MKQILIINFKRFGDILSMGEYISSLIEKYPQAHISLLIFEEFSRISNCFQNVKKVYTIDRKKILVLKKNKIFSSYIALNELNESIKDLRKIHWNHIVNYSSDRLASFIIPSLKHSHYYGIKYNQKSNKVFSSEWSKVLNEVVTSYHPSPLTLKDCHFQIAKISPPNEMKALYVDEKHNAAVIENFTKIRNYYKLKWNKNIKIIGIQLLSSQKEKNIPTKTLIKTIEQLTLTGNYFPVLLIAPNDHEREYANSITKSFKNKIIIIESSFKNLIPVLLNIDLVITPDTFLVHMANLTNTPLVNVIFSNKYLYQHGTSRTGDLVLKFNDKNIDHKAICDTVNLFYNKNFLNMNLQSRNVSIYEANQDQLGTKYVPLAGNFNIDLEYRYQLSRLYMAHTFLDKNLEITDYFEENLFNTYSLDKYLTTELMNVQQVLKYNLQILKKIRSNNRDNNTFIIAIQKIIDLADENTILTIPISLFKEQISTIEAFNFVKNIAEFERIVLQLKDEIVNIVELINEIKNYKKSHSTVSQGLPEQKQQVRYQDARVQKGTTAEA